MDGDAVIGGEACRCCRGRPEARLHGRVAIVASGVGYGTVAGFAAGGAAGVPFFLIGAVPGGVIGTVVGLVTGSVGGLLLAIARPAIARWPFVRWMIGGAAMPLTILGYCIVAHVRLDAWANGWVLALAVAGATIGAALASRVVYGKTIACPVCHRSLVWLREYDSRASLRAFAAARAAEYGRSAPRQGATAT